MNRSWSVMRRTLVTLLAAAVVGGCGTPATPADTVAARQALAPAGKLRVGVYLGSPTSLVRGAVFAAP